MSISDYPGVLVIDNGSRTTQAGLAGDDAPSILFSTVVGKQENENAVKSSEVYIGDEAQQRREIMSLTYPIKHGIVTNWEDMQKVWDYTFLKLGDAYSPDVCPILLAEPPLNPKANREMMAQVMFETYNCAYLYVALQDVLSMYTFGRVSAITLDCGAGVSHVAPIYEGRIQPQSIRRIDFGGGDLTSYMASLLASQGYSFTTPAELEIVEDIKEKLCYTALDFEKEMTSSTSLSATENFYELPDGSTIKLNSEQCKVPECLFQPSLMGVNTEGLHEMVYNSIMSCAIDTRPDISCNVMLGGGSSMFPGFRERMLKELKNLFPSRLRVQVIAAPERAYSVWIGGSILGSLTTFRDGMLISKSDYEEFGPSVVHRKCP